MRIQYVLLGLVGLFVAIALASSTSSMKPKDPDMPASEIAIKAANDHDRVVSLSSLKGKVVLIDFWATWCGPCRMSIPGIQKLYDKAHSRGFEVIGVSTDQEGADLAGFAREMKITYPAGAPVSADQVQPYTSGSIPQMVLVDRKGNVSWMPPAGFSPQMESELEERVGNLLKE